MLDVLVALIKVQQNLRDSAPSISVSFLKAGFHMIADRRSQ